MKLFLGTHSNPIDRKGRVSVPAAWRRAVGLRTPNFDGFISFPSPLLPCLEGWTEDQLDAISQRVDPMDLLRGGEEDFPDDVFGGSHPLTFQDGGRVILPRDQLDYAGITDQAVFVGMGQTFRIWAPDRFDAWRADLAQNRGGAK